MLQQYICFLILISYPRIIILYLMKELKMYWQQINIELVIYLNQIHQYEYFLYYFLNLYDFNYYFSLGYSYIIHQRHHKSRNILKNIQKLIKNTNFTSIWVIRDMILIEISLRTPRNLFKKKYTPSKQSGGILF